MKKLRLIRNNSFDTITAPTLEELNHEKNKLELENNELYDVCCFGNDDTTVSKYGLAKAYNAKLAKSATPLIM